MRILFLDCFSGISGDMAVGALLDLGLDTGVLKSDLSRLGLDDEFRIEIRREKRHALEGVKFDVIPAAHQHDHPERPQPHSREDRSHGHGGDGHHRDHDHGHSHGHGDHAHGRPFREIAGIVERSRLAAAVRARIVSTFRRIAVAEGKIHGMPPDEVTFHEVGAIDSIVDIAAFCIGIDRLGVTEVAASRVVDGTGHVDCAHGRFPLPAPATLEILAGIPVTQIDEPDELVTPTGAAILAEFSASFGGLRGFAAERVGYGIGTRDPASRANVLRAAIGRTAGGPLPGAESDRVIELQTNLDDLTPELAAPAIDRLLAAGALEAFFAPVTMKKGRLGLLLTVLVGEAERARVEELILRETSAFGVRAREVTRSKLRRRSGSVQTRFGEIECKFGFLGDELVQAKPEFESCRIAAEAAGASIREVHAAATRALADEAGTP